MVKLDFFKLLNFYNQSDQNAILAGNIWLLVLYTYLYALHCIQLRIADGENCIYYPV